MDFLKKLLDLFPVSSMSMLAVVVLDVVWTGFEIPATITVVGLLLLCIAFGIAAFFAVLMVERFVSKKPLGEAFALAFVMGLVAGVPYCVTSLLFGGAKLTTYLIAPKRKTDQAISVHEMKE